MTNGLHDRGRPRALGHFLALVMLLSACACGVSAPVRAAELPLPAEQKIKSAYLFNFAGYVEWPADMFPNPQSPIHIAVVGSEPIAAELARIAAGRTVHGRAISVHRLEQVESLESFHIVFVAAKAAVGIKEIAQAALVRSVLVVTEAPDSLMYGSIINFVVSEDRVRFEIALDRADRSNLKLSSRLLSIAQQVRTEAP